MVLLFLMLLALPLASRAKDTFYIEPVNVVPGESKTITLNLDNSQVFRGFQTDIELPEGLKIASRSNGNFDISLTDRGSSSFSVSSNLMSDGSVRILGYSTQGESIKGNQGALVRISVRASSDFSGGYIKLKNSIFSDVNNRDVKLDNSQLFVGTKEQNDVSVKGGEISPEVSKAFSLELSNESEMTAFQMDVVLPNGLSLDLSKTRLTGRCGNHQLQTKQLGNGKVRIICMSSDNTSISGKIGSVIDLWIKAEKGITGNQIVKLENIIFSDVKARTYRMDPFSFVVDVKYVPVTSVSISESNMQLEVSDSRQLTASLLPENCTDKTILWKSDNEKVATVSDNGMIIARSAGQCSIIASTADNLIQAKCVVTVVKIPLTAHVANTTKVYGDANPEFNITYSGFRDGDSEVGFSVPASISTIVDNSSKVGKYDIVASGAVSDKYEISYIPGTLTITKAPLSISAGNYTKKQGDAMPVFKASYAGFKNGENESVLTKQPVFSCEANEASAPAEYAVTISGAEAENYDISYEQGRLTVVEADAVVVRAKSYSRQYGDENPVFEFETEGAALDGTPEIVCSAVANSPVGSYTIEVKQGSIKNYNVHFESGSLVITKAPLSISAGNYTKKQGAAMPVFKASYAGFKNGEDESVLTKQPVFSCEANEASAPAEYAVTISGADAENYEISYEQGVLTVTGMPKPIISTDKAMLRITTETDNAVIYYTLDGTEPNENARKYTEPINLYASCEIKAIAVKGDAKSEVSSAEYHDAEYPNIVKVGDIITANIINNGEENLPMIFKVTSVYPFNVEMENKEDYVEGWSNERDVSGTLEIPAVVKANGICYCVKKLGGNSLAMCTNVSSLKLNEGLESIGGQAIRRCRNIKELIVPNSVKEVWGAFLTEDHGLVSVVLGAGLETIHTDAFWGVSMNLKSFISLSTNPAKCVEPDRTFTSLPEDVTLYVPLGSKSAYETAPGWDYFAGHIVEMDMSPATVKVKDCAREYGDDNPTLEFETEGATLIGEPEIICSADKKSKVGTYEIEINKGTIKNYLVTFVPGTLTVTKAPLVVTAENYTITQGDKLPEFTASYSGFKNGENVSVLTKQPVFSCDANEASAPGEYPINVYGVEADNYNAISYVAGTLTVLKRELKKQTITWDQEIKAKVGSTIEMNATASSGLPVRYSYALAPGVETAYQVPQIEGNKITFPQNGMYLLVAIQDGNNEYAAATDTLDVCAISDDEGLMYIDGIYYKYTDDGSALKVVRGYNPYRGKVEIPATVNGLPVTKVDGQAMYACYYLNEVVIGDNVAICGREAFGASRNLQKVTLPANQAELRLEYIFNCDDGIKEIHCRSSVPYLADESLFNGFVNYDNCILFVPVGTKQSYANAEVWKNFTHIVEENVSTSISNINVEKKSVWYTLQGVKLFAKPNIPGVYIHNGKKIIVR